MSSETMGAEKERRLLWEKLTNAIRSESMGTSQWLDFANKGHENRISVPIKVCCMNWLAYKADRNSGFVDF